MLLVARKDGNMEQKLYKELTLKDIDKHLKNDFGVSKEVRNKVMKWAEKKALDDYIKGKWSFNNYGK